MPTPQTLDECKGILEKSVCISDASEHQIVLQKSIRNLLGNWIEAALRPLYEANKLVAFLTNLLTPFMESYLVERGKFDGIVRTALKDRASLTHHSDEFDSIISNIGVSCKQAARRSDECTDEFNRMREAMDYFAADTDVYNGLKLVYVSDGMARMIIKLMFERLNQALSDHREIVKSTDIPLSVLSLSM